MADLAPAASPLRTAAGLFCGYASYNAMRGVFPQQMGAIAGDLDIPLEVVGLPNSIFSAAYGVAKFFASVATDYLPCREAHAFGIVLSGACAASLACCGSLHGLALTWALQGVIQAFGWPFLARIVVTDLPAASRARYWGALSMAGSVGAMATPYGIVLARRMGLDWRGASVACGTAAASMSAVVWLLLRTGSSRKATPGPCQAAGTTTASGAAGRLSTLAVFLSPFWLALLGTNALAYLCCKAVKEWGPMYLTGLGMARTDLNVAALLFWAEVGGSVGALSSGFISTGLFGGRHALTCALCAAIASAGFACMALAARAKSGDVPGAVGEAPLPLAVGCAMQAVTMMGLTGVRALVGFHAAETAARSGMVGLANGWMEVVGQIGSVIAGQPLGAAAVYASTLAAGAPAATATASGWTSVVAALSVAAATMAAANALLVPGEARRLRPAAAGHDAKKSQ